MNPDISNLSFSEKLALMQALASDIHSTLRDNYKPKATPRGGLPIYLIAAQVVANIQLLAKYGESEMKDE